MRIGFNAQIVSSWNAGVAIYARNLLTALAEIAAPDEIVGFVSDRDLRSLALPNLRVVSAPGLGQSWLRIVWEQTILPFQTREHRIDAMFYPDHTAPLLQKSCPVIITIHDVAFFAYPHTFPQLRRMYKSLAVRRSVERADAIVVVSEATKRECLKYLGVDESKLHVIPNGLDPHFTVITDTAKLQEARRKYTLPERYILFVGTLEPRKNLTGLIQAFARLPDGFQLVIVGARGWLYNDLFRLVKALDLGDRVHFLGYVPVKDLVYLYNLAELFVYPSLYEGFGFPPLEAMACGVPVIASETSSLPEVVGDAGVLVDPGDPDMLTTVMHEFLTHPEMRQEYRRRGLERAKLFSWHKTAARVLELCRAVARRNA